MRTKIIYLHGFASSPSSSKARFFAERIPALAIPDLSDGNFTGLTLTGQLAVIDRVVAGSPCMLIGSSLGGYLASLYAARHANVERIVLLAPAFDFASRWIEWLGPTQLEEWRRTGHLAVFNYALNANADLGYGLMADALQYEPEPDFKQPCLICHGTLDDVVPIESSRRFAAGRKNVELLEFDSGHELLNVTEELWQAVQSFFALPQRADAQA